jgi:hypothetical protein
VGWTPFAQHPGTELTGSSFSHLARKDQASPIRPAEVKVIADQRLDQSPALLGVGKNLCTAHFHLPDTQLMPVPGRLLLWRERPGNFSDRAVEQDLNLFRSQLVTKIL